MARNLPFNRRFQSTPSEKPIDGSVPRSARIGLLGVLRKFEQAKMLPQWFQLADEVLHVARKLGKEYASLSWDDTCEAVILNVAWDKYYVLIEKIYRILQPAQRFSEGDNAWFAIGTIEESRLQYTNEINELFAEENLAYEFDDGFLFRRGRPHLQKSIRLASAVLADSEFATARNHYNKAITFFRQKPLPDPENCIKEAVCSLEAAAEVLLDKKASKNFDEVIRARQGNSEGKIPPAIGDGMIKLRAFRGNAKGVAHAASEGGFVGLIEAELVLSVVASYITYLRDRFPLMHDDIPF